MINIKDTNENIEVKVTRTRKSRLQIQAEMTGKVWVPPTIIKKERKQPVIKFLEAEYKAWGAKNTGAVVNLNLNTMKKVEIIINGNVIEQKNFDKIIDAYSDYIGLS